MNTAPRRRLLPRLARMLRRYRRPLAGLLAGLAVLLTLQLLAPPDPGGYPVLTAATDLAAGHLLAEGDLRTLDFPPGLVPPDHFSPGPAPGRAARMEPGPPWGARLAAPLKAGSLVTAAGLVGPGLLTGAPPGSVAVPVRPADPGTAGLLKPGQLVDIVLSEGNGFELPASTTVLARGAAVLWTSSAPGRDWLGAESDEGMVVVAAPAAAAAEIAGAAHRGDVFLVLVG